ncbi:MAG: CvpA family protein [Candidatus Electrothrix communis]|nr:MAG: CvpA family protein [Candidatus Electrothrix communis]
MNFASIALFDYILLAVLILFVVHGLWLGFLRQLPFVVALIGSYAASCQYAGELMPHVSQLTESPKIVFGGGFLALLIVSTLLFKLIGKLMGKIIKVKSAGWANRFFLGAPLALAKVAVLVVLVVMFWAATLPPSTDHLFRDSLTAPYLEQGADIVRSFIGDAEIRKDLKPRKAPVQKKVPVKRDELALSPTAQQEPDPDQSQPQQQSQPDQSSSGADDPASSTEVLE